jgi:signal transduction histidine kinase
VPELSLVVFLVTQEAIRNVWRYYSVQRYAGRDRIEFQENKTRISIRDNGKGFYPPEQIGNLAREGKLGLAGMHERARLIGGTMSVQSELGNGTNISIEILA